ncbi:MAG: ABC transporter substrate-binding protein [Candidatus Methanomethylophilaceae archaeon]|nr:ABC transporter substrate-binding protein [Candidatus Methanomethylophilaceae archaeon]
MDKKVLAIVAIVAVVVVIGAVVVFAMNGDNKELPNSNNLDGRLAVFGNANNDDYLDSRDVDFVKKIIAGEEEATYYECYLSYGGSLVKRSLADANCDGKIDEADVKWIQRMVDREQNMLIYFYDVDAVVGHCTYPLSTAAVGYKSNYDSMVILGAIDNVKYVCNQVGDNGNYHKWFTMFDGATCFGSRFTPDYEIFVKEGNTPPSFMLSGTRAWFDPNMEETCGPLGIDVVRLPFYEDNWTVPAIITLGYLLNHEKQAYEYAKTADSVYETIKDTLKDVKLEDRPLVFASYALNSVSAMHGGVQELVTLAGGRNVIDAGYSKGNLDGEAIVTMNPDWIISSQYFGYMETYEDHDSCQKAMYTQYGTTDGKYEKNIVMTNAYKNGNVLLFNQGVYMGTASYVACAYLANHLYPDKFNFDVDALFDDYLSKYHPDWKASDFKDIDYLELSTYLAKKSEYGI